MSVLNRWQAAQQAAWLLKRAVWPDPPGEVVLSWAAVSDLPIDHVAQFQRFPFALVRPGTGDSWPEHPEMAWLARFDIEIAQVGQTDMEGSSPLIGGNRVVPTTGLTHQGTSGGRGLYELEEVLRQALESKDDSLGFQSVCTIAASNTPVPLADGEYASSSKLQLEVQNVSRDRIYPTAKFKTAVGSGGIVTLAWFAAAQRWDSLAQEIYWQLGATPPARGVGTLVSLAPGVATTAINIGAGHTASFSLFNTFDETGNLVAERVSAAATVASISA